MREIQSVFGCGRYTALHIFMQNSFTITLINVLWLPDKSQRKERHIGLVMCSLTDQLHTSIQLNSG